MFQLNQFFVALQTRQIKFKQLLLKTYNWIKFKQVLLLKRYNWIKFKQVLLLKRYNWIKFKQVLLLKTYNWIKFKQVLLLKTYNWIKFKQVLLLKTSNWIKFNVQFHFSFVVNSVLWIKENYILLFFLINSQYLVKQTRPQFNQYYKIVIF